MASDGWTWRTLGEATDNFDSLRVPVKSRDRRPGPYPYYGASGVIDYIDQYIFDDGEYLLVAEDGENLRTRSTPVAFLANGRFWVNNHAHVVRGNHLADTRYLAYALAVSDISGYLTGSTMPKLTQDNMNRIRLLLPSLEQQKTIVAMLGDLDDKIELNRRMNETLEAMARAIFKSWFVDFDPIRAKAEGRQPFGMDAETAALFPDSFEDSPLGKIPAGWQAASLPQAIDVNPRRPLPGGTMASYLEMTNMPTKSPRVLAGTDREFTSGTKFINGDVLVARITPCLENGKTAFVDFLPDGAVGWGSTEYLVLRSKPPLPEEFAYYLARSAHFRSHAITNMTGTSGRQRVPAEALAAYPLVVPSETVARAFGRLVRPAINAMKRHDEEAATLADLRDALLPGLLSGAIRPGVLTEHAAQQRRIANRGG